MNCPETWRVVVYTLLGLAGTILSVVIAKCAFDDYIDGLIRDFVRPQWHLETFAQVEERFNKLERNLLEHIQASKKGKRK